MDASEINSIRKLVLLFIACLVLSGLTAFPLLTEIKILARSAYLFPADFQAWINFIHAGLRENDEKYPFMSYGTDWLAFAHISIAVFFIGVWKDPIHNIWILKAGMVSCLLILPVAFIAGYFRRIPFWWQIIDCSFGVFGFVLLFVIYRKVLELVEIQKVYLISPK